MHDVTERGGEHTGAQAALLELLVGALEGGDAAPLEMTRIEEHLVAGGDLLDPVVEAADHEGDDGAHLGGVFALGLAALVDAGVGDGRVAGRADAAEGDGLGQLAGIRGIVPQGGGGVASGIQEGAGGVLDGDGGKHSFVIA